MTDQTPRPAIAEHDVTVHQGDVREQLALLPTGSVQCVVTSPPYYGLRAYSDDEREIGREESPAEYVTRLLDVFGDVARVLASNGVLWLNLGDSYYSGRGNPGPNADDRKNRSHAVAGRGRSIAPVSRGATRKSLLMIPERVTLGLMGQGWLLRNKCVWHKTNAMPESAADRLACRWEPLYLLTRSQRYYFDLDAIKVPTTGRAPGNTVENRQQYGASTGTKNGARRFGGNPGSTLLEIHETRNPGDVWSIPTQGFAGDHPAVMAARVAEQCILAGCPQDGTVLDPFAGSGTTLKVARSLGRKSIGIELNPDYIEIIRQRIGQTPLDFGEVPA